MVFVAKIICHKRYDSFRTYNVYQPETSILLWGSELCMLFAL